MTRLFTSLVGFFLLGGIAGTLALATVALLLVRKLSPTVAAVDGVGEQPQDMRAANSHSDWEQEAADSQPNLEQEESGSESTEDHGPTPGWIIRQIQTAIRVQYPQAVWVLEPYGMTKLLTGQPARLFLNRAGGYSYARARLLSSNKLSLDYMIAAAQPLDDYGLARYWLERNLTELELRYYCSCRYDAGVPVYVPASALPSRDTWPALAESLRAIGFTAVRLLDDGLEIPIARQDLPQKGE